MKYKRFFKAVSSSISAVSNNNNGDKNGDGWPTFVNNVNNVGFYLVSTSDDDFTGRVWKTNTYDKRSTK